MVIEFISCVISYLLLVVGVLIRVAFIILFERKILGFIQIRKGPNKVGFIGLIQSFRDAAKLFLKELIFPLKINFLIFYLRPLLLLVLVLFLWNLIGYNYNSFNSLFGGIFFFCCTALGVYMSIGRGWSSNSNYSIIGTLRNVSQTISYEVSMALIFLRLIFLIKRYNLNNLIFGQYIISLCFCASPLFFCWVVSMLAETNRTPFDFAEGESELVSGFNVEYRRGGFTILFLSEYARIIFISYLIVIIYLGGFCINSILGFNFIRCLFIFFFIWIRGCLPRYRYDKLMDLIWRIYLPVVLLLIIYFNLWELTN